MWNYALNNSEHAEATEEEIPTLITNGKISPDTLVWKAGMDGWVKARETELGKVIQLHQKQMPPPLAVIPPKLPTQYDERLAVFSDRTPIYATAEERLKVTFCEAPFLFVGSFIFTIALTMLLLLPVILGLFPKQGNYAEWWHTNFVAKGNLFLPSFLFSLVVIQTILDRSGIVKHRFNMKIVDYNSESPSYLQSFLRALLKITIIPIIWIQFTPKKPQGIHDLICKTVVIKTS